MIQSIVTLDSGEQIMAASGAWRCSGLALRVPRVRAWRIVPLTEIAHVAAVSLTEGMIGMSTIKTVRLECEEVCQGCTLLIPAGEHAVKETRVEVRRFRDHQHNVQIGRQHLPPVFFHEECHRG